MTVQSQRTRVERLLSGDVRPDDLTRLFLYLRDRCDGRESVEEVGDFVAHHSERTKGLVTRAARDWFYIAKVLSPLQMRNQPINLLRLPDIFPEFLSASLRRAGKAVFQKTGITTKAATAMLPEIKRKFVRLDDGALSISLSHAPEEVRLILALCVMVVQPAFSDKRLCADFEAALKSSGLIKNRELSAFRKVYPAITLFAVAEMHQCAIVLPDGSRAVLEASGPPGGTITVWMGVPVPAPEIGGCGHVMIASGIFGTSLTAEYCEPELLKVAWNFGIELTSNIKLGKLA